MIIFVLIIDAILTIVPLIMTGIYYPVMPEKIPLFVNLMGEPVMTIDKTVFTAFRLPIMALILQAVCLVMYLGCRENTRHNPKTSGLFRNFWIVASLTAAVKLSFSSLPYTGVVPHHMIQLFRTSTLAAAVMGVVYLLMCLYAMLKEEGENLVKIFIPAGNAYSVLIAVLLAACAAVVFFR